MKIRIRSEGVCLRLSCGRRKGAIAILIIAMLLALLAMAAFAVDVSYMQLTQAELRAATDAAAKAAARELSLTDGNEKLALDAARDIAGRNMVGGKPLQLATGDLQFGQAVRQSDGTLQFSPGVTPYTSVRVTSDLSSGSLTGTVQLFFSGTTGQSQFAPRMQSTATYPESELLLAIDRSHSMAFDTSGVKWSYPPGVPPGDMDGDGRVSPDDFSDDALLTPPNTAGTRWSHLDHAIDHFVDVLNSGIRPPRVGVVTWASDIGTSTYEYSLTGQTFDGVTREVDLTRQYARIRNAIAARGNNMMLGGTDIAAGMDEAVAMLLASPVRAKKAVILMTDGQETHGRGALNAAHDAAAAGIIVHTVSFLDGDQSLMRDVATITGGHHLHAANETELTAAFEELARLLPVSLIQ